METARRAFKHRRIDPFFELQILEDMKLRPESTLRDAIRHYAPCAVLQMRDGPEDELAISCSPFLLPTTTDTIRKMVSALFIAYSIFSIDIARRQAFLERQKRDLVCKNKFWNIFGFTGNGSSADPFQGPLCDELGNKLNDTCTDPAGTQCQFATPQPSTFTMQKTTTGPLYRQDKLIPFAEWGSFITGFQQSTIDCGP